MLRKLSVLLLACLLTASCLESLKSQSEADVLGIRIGMPNEEAAKRLRQIGRLEKEEKKQQEVWVLNDDPRYSFLIIGFDKEEQDVRYVTAKTRENGTPVRYGDVMDVGKAQHISSANNHKYVQEKPRSLLAHGYSIIASGTDPNNLTYLSLKKQGSGEEEKEEEEE